MLCATRVVTVKKLSRGYDLVAIQMVVAEINVFPQNGLRIFENRGDK